MDDAVAAPVWLMLMGCEGVEKMTAVSTAGRTDIYLHVAAGFDERTVRGYIDRRLAMAVPTLPASAACRAPALLPADSSVPIVHPKLVEQNFIQIDREKVEADGLSLSDLDKQLAELPDRLVAGQADALGAAVVKLPGGKSVRLGDIATVEKTKTPDAVVRTYP